MDAEMICSHCGEELTEDSSASCNSCFRRFHLRLQNDAGGKDCGEVWINEQYLSLEFACFPCLGVATRPPGPAEPPVGEGH